MFKWDSQPDKRPDTKQYADSSPDERSERFQHWAGKSNSPPTETIRQVQYLWVRLKAYGMDRKIAAASVQTVDHGG